MFLKFPYTVGQILDWTVSSKEQGNNNGVSIAPFSSVFLLRSNTKQVFFSTIVFFCLLAFPIFSFFFFFAWLLLFFPVGFEFFDLFTDPTSRFFVLSFSCFLFCICFCVHLYKLWCFQIFFWRSIAKRLKITT